MIKIGKRLAEKMIKKIRGESVELVEMMVPREMYEKFEIEKTIKKEEEIVIYMKERDPQQPAESKGKEMLLNGYGNSVEVLTGSVNGRAIFVRYTRRRWKDKESEREYQNEYEFHPKGLKTSQEFADFLKGKDREKSIQLLTSRRDVWDRGEEDV